MELFSLICFVTLAQNTKFCETAELLHISQSSISKYIQMLEHSFGAKLFIRSPHGSELTEAGAELLPYAKKIVQEYSNAERLLEAYKERRDSRLIISTHSFLSQYRLSEMLLRFQELNPGAQLEIIELASPYAIQALQADPSSICIVFSKSDTVYEDFDQHSLIYDDLVLLVGRQHPLSGCDEIHISELREEKFQIMLMHHEPFLFDFIMEQCGKVDFTPEISPYGLWFSTIPTTLLWKNMVSILPRRIAEHICSPETKILNLLGPDSFTVQIMKSKNNHSEIARSFYEFAKSYLFPDALTR